MANRKVSKKIGGGRTRAGGTGPGQTEPSQSWTIPGKLTSRRVLETAVDDGAEELWLEHEVLEARAVHAHVRALSVLIGIGGGSLGLLRGLGLIGVIVEKGLSGAGERRPRRVGPAARREGVCSVPENGPRAGCRPREAARRRVGRRAGSRHDGRIECGSPNCQSRGRQTGSWLPDVPPLRYQPWWSGVGKSWGTAREFETFATKNARKWSR